MSRRKRTEIIVFRLTKKERQLLLDGPAEALEIPNSDLIRMALYDFSKKSNKAKKKIPAAKGEGQ